MQRSVPQVLHPAVCIVSAWLYSTYYTGSGKLLDAQLWPVLGEYSQGYSKYSQGYSEYTTRASASFSTHSCGRCSLSQYP